MALVYTPETVTSSASTSFEEFLDILAGLKLSPASTHIDLDHRRLEVYGNSVKLSNREYELLAYLAGHADEIVSREELLESVWYGEGLESQTRTIDAHIRRLRAKLPSKASQVIPCSFTSTPSVRVSNTRVHTLAA